MNKKNRQLLVKSLASVLLSFLLFACESDDTNEVILYERGVIEATSTNTNIEFGESITYTDMSTKVHTRKWVFQGGNPSSSSDSVVTVVYPIGGTFNTVLEIVHIDNQKGSKVFDVEVTKDPGKEIPEYDFGNTYGLFTEMPDITPGLSSVDAVEMNHFPGTKISEAYEGVEAYVFKATGESDWAMAGLQAGNNQYTNFSPFEDGYYNFTIKSECQATILIRIRSTGGGNVIFEFTADGEEYGFKRDGEWHMVSIPVSDIVAKDFDNKLNLSQITEFLLFRSGAGDVRDFDNYEFYVDHIFLSEKVELK